MVFAVAEEEVSYEQRTAAKMVAYGLAYGMEAYGLAQRLGIGNKEAELILDSFFSALPQVKGYMEETIKKTREVGYTTTEFGRRRYLPELASSDARVRQAAERQAMNAGIQGLAADIFKKALVNLAQLVRGDKGIQIVLQVHDEIVVEAIDSEVPRARDLLEKTMSGAAELRVPLSVSVSVGQNWGDAKH
jgi:DNA polymerase-1